MPAIIIFSKSKINTAATRAHLPKRDRTSKRNYSKWKHRGYKNAGSPAFAQRLTSRPSERISAFPLPPSISLRSLPLIAARLPSQSGAQDGARLNRFDYGHEQKYERRKTAHRNYTRRLRRHRTRDRRSRFEIWTRP